MENKGGGTRDDWIPVWLFVLSIGVTALLLFVDGHLNTPSDTVTDMVRTAGAKPPNATLTMDLYTVSQRAYWNSFACLLAVSTVALLSYAIWVILQQLGIARTSSGRKRLPKLQWRILIGLLGLTIAYSVWDHLHDRGGFLGALVSLSKPPKDQPMFSELINHVRGVQVLAVVPVFAFAVAAWTASSSFGEYRQAQRRLRFLLAMTTWFMAIGVVTTFFAHHWLTSMLDGSTQRAIARSGMIEASVFRIGVLYSAILLVSYVPAHFLVYRKALFLATDRTHSPAGNAEDAKWRAVAIRVNNETGTLGIEDAKRLSPADATDGASSGDSDGQSATNEMDLLEKEGLTIKLTDNLKDIVAVVIPLLSGPAASILSQ